MNSLAMHKPLVSIIVPCYNQAHFLDECLQSVVKQSFTNWECIIVDDGSADNTSEVATHFCSTDDRFQYIHQINKGLSGARNTGAGVAQGNYFHFLDSDDALFPNAINLLVQELEQNTTLVMVYGGYVGCMNSLGKIVKKAIPHFDNAQMSFYELLCKGNVLPVHAALVRKRVISEIGLFDESLKSCEDWDFWLRLGRVTNGVKVIPKVLVKYRMSSTSMTRNVDTFFRAGLCVLDRTVISDSRVKNPLPQYLNGFKNHYNETLVKWYAKGAGLFLAQYNLDGAIQLAVELMETKNKKFSLANMIYLWKQLIFGAVLGDNKKEAWHNYKQVVKQFLESIGKLYGDNYFVVSAEKEIEYSNASRIKRLFLVLKRK